MSPDALSRLQALQPGLGVQGGTIAANPHYFVACAPSPVLYFDDGSLINHARCAIQASAPAADVTSVRILLKRMAKRVHPAYAYPQPGGETRLRTGGHATL